MSPRTTTRLIRDIGKVSFTRKKGMRNITVHVEPFKGVYVSFPWFTPLKDAEAVVLSNLEWVKKKLDAMRKLEKKYDPQQNLFDTVSREDAKTYLTERTLHLAREYGFKVNRVTVRNQKTRWGSCSQSNNISLNAKLMLIEPELRDYVILHELVHTKVKNHGPGFWAALSSVIDRPKVLDKRMVKYHLALM